MFIEKKMNQMVTIENYKLNSEAISTGSLE